MLRKHVKVHILVPLLLLEVVERSPMEVKYPPQRFDNRSEIEWAALIKRFIPTILPLIVLDPASHKRVFSKGSSF
jgi:hypothetical protein